MRWLFLITCLSMLIAVSSSAQVSCTMPGQTPTAAFTLCGNNSFFQPKLSSCYNRAFFVAGCTNSNTGYGDINPVYYQFTCKTTGSFGFTVTPANTSDNYDWQLFDITGRNPNDIYGDKTISIAGNWSGSLGATGASAAGVNYIQCRSFPYEGAKPTFAAMPQLTAGHTYLLVISCADNAGNFNMAVGGGTADITSAPLQDMKAQLASCTNKEVLLTFGRKIKCSSVAADGSDFTITPATGTFTATGTNCSSGETDTVRISFTNPLLNNTYTITLKNGLDGNTLLDGCNNAATAGMQISFNVLPYAVIDTLVQPGCAPGKLTLHFTKPILCSSIAANGSDFIISGPSTVPITAASFTCNTAETKTVELTLKDPVTTGGNYAISFKNGTDGNTLLDQCNGSSPAGLFHSFTVKNQPDANFTFSVLEGCVADTVLLNHPGGNGVNVWQWTFTGGSSNVQQPTVIYKNGGNEIVSLVVSNGLCSSTIQKNFVLKEKLNVAFTAPAVACNDEAVVFTNKSTNATSWLWNFGNGITSIDQNPAPQSYPQSLVDKTYTISLAAQNGNCTNDTTQTILVKSTCTIAVPSAFTPNGDGLNDGFGPINSNTVNDLTFLVFNRYGQTVFTHSSTASLWNGKVNGVLQPAGVYIWALRYTDAGKTVVRRGTVVLVR